MKAVTPENFDTIYDIYMDETINPFMSYDPCPKEEFKTIFQELMARDLFWLFQHEGKDCAMCGVILSKGRKKHSATIVSLGIKKEFQGLGIGKKIMHDVVQHLRNMGIWRIALTAEADNDRAISFYKKLGFEIEGRLSKYLKRDGSNEYIDEILMAKIFN